MSFELCKDSLFSCRILYAACGILSCVRSISIVQHFLFFDKEGFYFLECIPVIKVMKPSFTKVRMYKGKEVGNN